MGLSPKSNYEKKTFLVLTSGMFLEALGRGIGTGSIFLPFIFSFEQGERKLAYNRPESNFAFIGNWEHCSLSNLIM